MTPRAIVLVLPDPPLPFGNAAARWYTALVRGLLERGHDLSVFAVAHDDADREALAAEWSGTALDLRVYRPAGRTPLARWGSLRRPHSYLFDSDFHRDLRRRLDEPHDVIHLEQVWSGWAGWHTPDRTLLHVHFLFQLDLAGAPVRSLHDRLVRHRTYAAERRIVRRFRNVGALSSELAAHVQRLAPRASVHVIPFGFEVERYPFPAKQAPKQPPTVGLIGSFNWHPTLQAGRRLLQLWPRLRRAIPGARLRLVGREARTALGPVAAQDVEVIENVAGILPYFHELDVMVYAPPRGSGTKVKVLEAFALGVPVVTTAAGLEGIAATPGVQVRIAEEDDALIEETIALLEPTAWRTQRDAARALVEERHHPAVALDRVEEVYARLVGRPA